MLRLIRRTKGGMSTKLHAVTDANGHPMRFFMTSLVSQPSLVGRQGRHDRPRLRGLDAREGRHRIFSGAEGPKSVQKLLLRAQRASQQASAWLPFILLPSTMGVSPAVISVTKKYEAVPPALQRSRAARRQCSSHFLDTGHLPLCSAPDELARLIDHIARLDRCANTT